MVSSYMCSQALTQYESLLYIHIHAHITWKTKKCILTAWLGWLMLMCYFHFTSIYWVQILSLRLHSASPLHLANWVAARPSFIWTNIVEVSVEVDRLVYSICVPLSDLGDESYCTSYSCGRRVTSSILHGKFCEN